VFYFRATDIICKFSFIEEEIDVVTIEKPKRRLSVSSVSSEEPPVKRLKPVAVRAKSYSTHTECKEFKRQASSGSDEEDGETKRATHNVLERKRRNDLKTSFHQLRAEVPEIETNERSPKVVILKKAKDYVEQLKNDEARLRKELDKENKRNKELLNKLSALGHERN
jgi:Myc proto-oncogene protein